MMAQAANQEKFQVRNSPFIRLNNEIKTEPVMIAPSPVPTVKNRIFRVIIIKNI